MVISLEDAIAILNYQRKDLFRQVVALTACCVARAVGQEFPLKTQGCSRPRPQSEATRRTSAPNGRPLCKVATNDVDRQHARRSTSNAPALWRLPGA
jgi:hypothetical protein